MGAVVLEEAKRDFFLVGGARILRSYSFVAIADDRGLRGCIDDVILTGCWGQS